MNGDRTVPQGPVGRDGWTPELSGWLLATLAILLAVVLLAIGSATLYLVGKTNDQVAKYQATQRAVTASKDLLEVYLARQVRSQAKDQDLRGRAQTAVNETMAYHSPGFGGDTTQVLAETEATISTTDQTLAATQQTLDETNALLDQAQEFVDKARQATAKLDSGLDGLEGGQRRLANQQGKEVTKAQQRLDGIDSRLDGLEGGQRRLAARLDEAATKIGDKLDDIERRLDAIEGRLDALEQHDPGSAGTVARPNGSATRQGRAP